MYSHADVDYQGLPMRGAWRAFSCRCMSPWIRLGILPRRPRSPRSPGSLPRHAYDVYKVRKVPRFLARGHAWTLWAAGTRSGSTARGQLLGPICNVDSLRPVLLQSNRCSRRRHLPEPQLSFEKNNKQTGGLCIGDWHGRQRLHEAAQQPGSPSRCLDRLGFKQDCCCTKHAQGRRDSKNSLHAPFSTRPAPRRS